MLLPINNITGQTKFNKDPKYKKPTFKAIKILSMDSRYNHLEPFIKSEIKLFHDKKTNAKFLGQGLFSKAYELLNFPRVVIKESLDRDNFEEEDLGLKNAPKALKNSQQFIARAFDDADYKHFILSTKVEGDSAHPKTAPWNEKTLKNLFNGMFEMDKEGFYHGDLNNGNVKIDKNGNVNFLDYQWATKLEYYGDQFMEKVYQCLAFMGTYLNQKAQYHLNRAKFFGNNLETQKTLTRVSIQEKKAIEFDKAQAMILNNATLDTIRLEAKKIQFLASFREAYRFVDPNTPIKNPLNAPAAYLIALNNLQWFRKEVEKQKEGVDPESYQYDYLKGMQEYGEYWFEKLNKWSNDALSCGIYLAKISPYFDGIPKGVNIEYFRPINCFLDTIDKKYMPKYTNNLEFKDSKIEENLENLKNAIYDEDSFLKDNTLVALYNLKESFKDNKALKTLNNALVLHRRITEEVQAKYSSKVNLNNEINSGYAFYPTPNSETLAQNLITSLFHKIKNQIINTPLKTEKYYGYDGMNNF